VLIDHGHFQYNGISLGLSAAAVAAVLRERHVLGAVLYTLAFNHKQARDAQQLQRLATLLTCFLRWRFSTRPLSLRTCWAGASPRAAHY
jgi:hypothetical protein